MRRKKENMWNQVQRFSIRKFSFGVTSALIGTFFLANASMVQAEVESGTDSALHTTKPEDKIGTGKPNENAQPVVAIEDKKVETNVVAEKTEKASKEADKATKEQATDVAAPKADKSTLSQAIDTLSELLNQVNLKKVSRTSMLEYEGVLSKAREVFQNDAATQNEVDAQVRKVNDAISIAKSFPKVKTNTGGIITPKTGTDTTLVTPKTGTEIKHSLETVKEDLQKYLKKSEITTDKPNVTAAEEILENISKQLKNTTLTSKELTTLLEQAKTVRNSLVNEELRATSGARDSRNNQSMGEGSDLRAATVSQNWTSEKNILSYQRFRVSDFDGNLQNGNRQLTESKVDMTARFETINGSKYVVYDVFFNNDGRVIGGSTHLVMHRLILQPEILDLNSNGTYKGDTLRDLKFEIYHKNGNVGTLSQNPGNFSKTGTANFDPLSDNEKTKEGLTYYNNLDIRHNGSYGLDMRDTFKSNRNDPFLTMAVSRNGVYSGWSYGIGVQTINDSDAVHMQVKAKLKSGVTEEKVKEAYTLAVVTTKRPTTNQSYVFVSGRNASENYTNVPDRPVTPTVKQSEEYPIKGKEVIKTVGDSLGDVSNPVSSGFVVRNDDSTNFPDGMSWSWTNGQPNTSTAGIFKYNVTAKYYDNSSNSTTATLKVKPKTPVIDQNSVNEKAGKTGQTVTVNVGDGVPTGSTVTLYSGTTVIGTGNTNGTTATITVSKALPSTAITAKTTVQNNGKVESELSAPATPTEVPDRVAPTVSINGKALTANADDNRFIIYRGANFNPTFRVQDDKNNVTLSITGLPNGVGNISTNGSKEFDYTIPDNTVGNDAPFGESTATVVANDGRNSATYKFKYRIVDVQAGNTNPENRAIGSELGDPHSHLKVADSATSDSDKYYPTGMQFKWKEFNSSTFSFTDVANNTKLNEVGNVTKYTATAVFPNTVNSKTIGV